MIGGAAGAIPALSGWAAANGHLGPGAWYLFAAVLIWTPPHFWALALLLEREYAAARVPMLPVAPGARATALQVMLYALLLAAVTIVPGATGTFGAFYLASAIVLGGVFCGFAWKLWRAVVAGGEGVVSPRLSYSISRCCTWRCCSWRSPSTKRSVGKPGAASGCSPSPG